MHHPTQLSTSTQTLVILDAPSESALVAPLGWMVKIDQVMCIHPRQRPAQDTWRKPYSALLDPGTAEIAPARVNASVSCRTASIHGCIHQHRITSAAGALTPPQDKGPCPVLFAA